MNFYSAIKQYEHSDINSKLEKWIFLNPESDKCRLGLLISNFCAYFSMHFVYVFIHLFTSPPYVFEPSGLKQLKLQLNFWHNTFLLTILL